MKIRYRFLSAFLVTALTAVLSGCGQLTGDSTGANLIGATAEIIGGRNAMSVGPSLYIFEGVASNGGNSGHLYRFEFELPEQEKISFILHGNTTLANGGRFIFERINGEVSLHIKLNGKEHRLNLPAFSDTNTIDIEIDFHNDHSDTHIIIWKSSGPFSDQEGCSFNESCLYNTEDYALDVWLGVGKASGSTWGFQGKRHLVKKVIGPLPVRSRL